MLQQGQENSWRGAHVWGLPIIHPAEVSGRGGGREGYLPVIESLTAAYRV